MKRKACELDEGCAPTVWGALSPLSDSPTPSSGSPQRCSIGAVPQIFAPLRLHPASSHLNLRTRKRFRDNRPEAETIHQNTIARLFDAQRQLSVHHSPVQESHIDEHILREQHGQGQITPEPNQRSIDSFFTHRRSQQLSTISRKPISVQQDTLTEQLAPCCEGCGSSLSGALGELQQASDTMDVDHMAGLFSGDEYQCAECARNFCDMCAVRGDHRICLECALAGGT